MEETEILKGDSAYNGHFGECIASLGDIDDDGYQGRFLNSVYTWFTNQ